ncbi:proton channel OTOP2-like [Heterodontus francisci]|uniref:proton channel OTOP2-like n=1 Tax=Heterodontus francisci TaxID=7792 RepID=UPI00355BCE8E
MADEMINPENTDITNEAALSQLEELENPWRLDKDYNFPSSAQTHPSKHQTHRGRLLSGLLAINAFFLVAALICGGAFSEVAVGQDEVLISLTVVMVLTVSWMLFYVLCTARQKHAILYKDPHAGPVWLRGGLLLFGACSLLLNVFRIVYAAGFADCEHPIKFLFPSIQIIFIFTQSYFLWVHSKDCIQIQQDITRCGLATSLICNLTLWMSAVADESIHQTGVEGEKQPDNQSRILTAGEDSECLCSTNVCHIFLSVYYYLYPFNIEYSLLASAMCYVMWKNVGRLIDDHGQCGKLKFHFHGIILGPILGVAMVLIGLGIFIIYELEMTDEGTRTRALIAYYIFNIVALTLMSISSLLGSLVYRFDKRRGNSDKNPTRSLDVGLLLGAALGQFLISYFSVVALVAVQPHELLTVLNLLFSLLTIIQHILQNTFIVEGLCRESFVEESQSGARNTRSYVRDSTSEVYVNMNISHRLPGDAMKHPFQRTLSQTNSISTSITNGQEAVPSHQEHSYNIHGDRLSASPHRLSWKRRILKEICSFLLLCNVIFWIMPAFGARPHFANGLEEKFYGFQMWVTIVNVGLPLGIFYRMHSAASLLEVYLTS